MDSDDHIRLAFQIQTSFGDDIPHVFERISPRFAIAKKTPGPWIPGSGGAEQVAVGTVFTNM
jgi:hypothetical protein